MTLTLQNIEAIAPDQASLSSAKKLLSDSKWQGQGFCGSTSTAWGECQGSGSKPYYVVVDVSDLGYKCTCPSRKFPCKHALALMWRYVDDPTPFVPDSAPEWVTDWLGRRKKSQKTIKLDESTPKKSIALADGDETQAPDPKQAEAIKKRAQKQKASTDAGISTGVMELVGWLDDQLRLGMGAFVDEMSERCRVIASRLVDAKASGLASLVDELPALILNAPNSDRATVAFKSFGRLYVICRAWQKDPDDVDVRRIVTKAENKETLMANLELGSHGVWQVVGERTQSRKDGLISHATYLIKITGDDDNEANTAVLIDFLHPTSGTKKSPSTVGALMAGRLIHYPSRVPFRAFFENAQTQFEKSVRYYDGNTPQPVALPDFSPKPSADNLHTSYAKQLGRLCWADEMLYVAGSGHIAQDEAGRFWYVSERETIPLSNQHLPDLVQGCDIQRAFILWTGLYGELLSVQTTWGLLPC